MSSMIRKKCKYTNLIVSAQDEIVSRMTTCAVIFKELLILMVLNVWATEISVGFSRS